MDQDNPNNFVESERGIILNEPQPDERNTLATAPEKAPKKHERKIVGTLLFLLAAGCIAFAVTQIDYTAISDNIAGAGYEAPDELAQIISELDLTDDGMRILKATRPELQDADAFNDSCASRDPNSSVLGCYNDRRIYIYNISRSELYGIRQATLAHELLHAVWARMSNSEQNSLTASLQKVNDSNADIQSDMEIYDVSDVRGELHSRVGTQVAPEQLPEDLRAHYAKYFKDPAKVVGFYDRYIAIFKEADAQIKALKALIEERRAKLADMQQEYNAKYNQFDADLDEYNQRRHTPGGFTSTEELRETYDALIDQQKQLQEDYTALTSYIAEINKLVNEHNQKAYRINDLQQSISSNSIKKAGNI